MKRYYLSTLAVLALTSSLYAESPDAYIGSIWATGANFCPTNAMPASGKTLDIHGYESLFALIGTTYGGNGTTNFLLPNLNGRTPIGITNLVELGQKRGQMSIALTAANLPPHTHAATFTPKGATTPVAVNVAVSSDPGTANQPSSGARTLSGSSTGAAGAKMWAPAPLAGSMTVGGVSVSNGAGAAKVTLGTAGTNQSSSIPTLPPVLGMTYCITVIGMYPDKQ